MCRAYDRIEVFVTVSQICPILDHAGMYRQPLLRPVSGLGDEGWGESAYNAANLAFQAKAQVSDFTTGCLTKEDTDDHARDASGRVTSSTAKATFSRH